MRVEIWADFICPWCGLGYHRLQGALRRFGKPVELVHRSFQLDEDFPEGLTEPVREMLMHRKGWALAQVATVTRRVEELAQADGLSPYIVADNRVGNTALAHELAAWATEAGRGEDMWRRLYRAYFGEARSIFAVEALVPLAEELGLDGEAARVALTSRRYAGRVRTDAHEAQSLGARGVPLVVVDRRYAVAGAQPTDVLLEMLEAAQV